jgi:AcrR family transcriptional regulator
MARKSASPLGSGSDQAATAAKPVRDAIIDALMELAAEHDWDAFDIPEIAERAGVSLAEFRDAFPSKGAILAGLSRRIDRAVLQDANDDLSDESAKERLFDVLMRRLDALAPYREAIRRIMRTMPRDPLTLAALNQLAVNSMRFMLASAKIDIAGPMGAIRIQGAVLVFARVLETWVKDDDEGLAPTMARLDRELVRGGRILARLDDFERLTAPFRALCRRNVSRPRYRERAWSDESPTDPAAAV